MNEYSAAASAHDPTLEIFEEIEEICDAFEAAWTSGNEPRIEEFLRRRKRADAESLLAELLKLDLEYRRQLGEVPTSLEYEKRLPDFAAQVGDFFRSRTIAFERPLTEATDMKDAPPPPAGYELLSFIDKGGMGAVYRARDTRLDREVALKVMLERRAEGSEAERRFVNEARIAGQLQHPGIPPVHELGTLPGGGPFLAMKLVKGQTLESLLSANGGDLRKDRGRFVAVFEQVCQAVGYAHSRRVIHRDLKPANVMVGAFAEVQVMDWGLAKVLPPEGTQVSEGTTDPPETPKQLTKVQTVGQTDSPTKTGSIMGTPAYMSPEQAGGEIDKLDPRSDVFSLGAILCRILTGKPPYSGKSSKEVCLQALRGETAVALAALDRSEAEPELLALCRRCLEFHREDRLTDGAAVAEEVARIRQAAEERARQAELERTTVLVREAVQSRHRRFLFRAAVAVMAVLAAASAVAIWSAVESRRQEQIAGEQRDEAQTQRENAQEAARSEGIARQTAERRLRQVRAHALSERAITVFDSDPKLGLLLSAEALRQSAKDFQSVGTTRQKMLQMILARNLSQLITRDPDAQKQFKSQGYGSRIRNVRFSPDSRWLTGLAGSPLKASFWRVDSAKPDVPLLARDDVHGNLAQLEVSPNSRWLAVRFQDRTVRLLALSADRPDGKRRTFDIKDDKTRTIAFSNDGRWLATGRTDGEVRLWDTNRPNPAGTHRSFVPPKPFAISNYGRSVSSIVFGPRGKLMAAVTANAVRIWNLDDPRPAPPKTLRTGSIIQNYANIGRNAVPYARFSPDGKWLVARPSDSSRRQLIRLSEAGKRAWDTDLGSVTDVTFNPIGGWLAATTSQRSVALWSLDDNAPKRFELTKHRGRIGVFAFSADGRTLATAGADGRVLFWKLAGQMPPQATEMAKDKPGIKKLAFSPDGKLFAAGSADGTVTLWRLEQERSLGKPRILALGIKPAGFRSPQVHLAFNRTGTRLAAGFRGGFGPGAVAESRIWDVTAPDVAATGVPVPVGRDRSGSLEFFPDDKWLITHDSTSADVWPADRSRKQDGKPTFTIKSDRPICSAMDRAGRWLAVGRNDGSLSLFDLRQANPIESPLTLPGHLSGVTSLAFSRDGKRLMSSSADLLYVRIVPPEAAAASIKPAGAPLRGISLTDEISRLIAVGDGRHVLAELRDPESGREDMYRFGSDQVLRRYALVDLSGAKPVVRKILPSMKWVTPSRDGRYLAWVSKRGIELWSLSQPFENRRVLLPLKSNDAVQKLTFMNDTRLLIRVTRETIRDSKDPRGSLVRHVFRSRTSQLEIWQLNAGDAKSANRTFLHTLPSQSELAASPDGRRLAAASSESTEVLLWDLAVKDPTESLTRLKGHRQGVTNLAFSPDGSFLASGAKDQTIRLWDLRGGSVEHGTIIRRDFNLRQSRGYSASQHEAPPMVFSPDGRWVFTFPEYGRPEGTRVLTGNESVRELINLAEKLAGRKLTAEQRSEYQIDVQ